MATVAGQEKGLVNGSTEGSPLLTGCMYLEIRSKNTQPDGETGPQFGDRMVVSHPSVSMGLELYLVRQIVEANDSGKGSVFTADLPLRQEAQTS